MASNNPALAAFIPSSAVQRTGSLAAPKGCRLDDRYEPALHSPNGADVAVFSLSDGMPRGDDQRVLSGSIFVIRNGLRQSAAPTSHGPIRLRQPKPDPAGCHPICHRGPGVGLWAKFLRRVCSEQDTASWWIWQGCAGTDAKRIQAALCCVGC